jgi:hypothetical protein
MRFFSRLATLCAIQAGLFSAPAAMAQSITPTSSFQWSLGGSNEVPGPLLAYGFWAEHDWVRTGTTLHRGETVIVTPLQSTTITCQTTQKSGLLDCGLGTVFGLPANASYVVYVDVNLSTLVGLAGLTFDNYPDVFITPDGTVTIDPGVAGGHEISLGIAVPSADGRVTLGFANTPAGWRAGWGTPGTSNFTWVALPDADIRTVKSINIFASPQTLSPATLPASASFSSLVIQSN